MGMGDEANIQKILGASALRLVMGPNERKTKRERLVDHLSHAEGI